MARLVTALVLLASTASTSYAQEEKPVIPDRVTEVANEVGEDPVALAGAVNTMSETIGVAVDPLDYLYGVGEIQRPMSAPAPLPRASGRQVAVRLTYYTLTGRTASGTPLYVGSTACSSNFAFGTTFQFSGGERVTCIDRGILGSSGWLDIWKQPGLVAKYGGYTTVTIVN